MKAIEAQFRKGEFSYMENKGNPEEVKEEISIHQPTKHKRKQSVLTKDCSKGYRRSKITFYGI